MRRCGVHGCVRWWCGRAEEDDSFGIKEKKWVLEEIYWVYGEKLSKHVLKFTKPNNISPTQIIYSVT